MTCNEIRRLKLSSPEEVRSRCELPSYKTFAMVRDRVQYHCHDIVVCTKIEGELAVLIARRFDPLTKAEREAGTTCTAGDILVSAVEGRMRVDSRDGRLDSVRHLAPYDGVFFFPGGRVRLPLSLEESALVKLRDETGVDPITCQGLYRFGVSTFQQAPRSLYTYQGYAPGGRRYSYDISVEGGAQQTINTLLVARFAERDLLNLKLKDLDNPVWVTRKDLPSVLPQLVPFMKRVLRAFFDE